MYTAALTGLGLIVLVVVHLVTVVVRKTNDATARHQVVTARRSFYVKGIGHSKRTARKHYLKVQDSHFEEAATAGVHQGVQNPAEPSGTQVITAPARHEKTLRDATFPAFPMLSKYTKENSNLQHPVPKGQRC